MTILQAAANDGWAMDAATLQYVIAPVILAVLAAIGWLARAYLQAIRQQVEPRRDEPDTTLRADVNRIIQVVEEHSDADRRLAAAVARIEVSVSRQGAQLSHQGAQLNRVENRLDAHLDNQGSR